VFEERAQARLHPGEPHVLILGHNRRGFSPAPLSDEGRRTLSVLMTTKRRTAARTRKPGGPDCLGLANKLCSPCEISAQQQAEQRALIAP
jgi:hypothetical protein